MDCTIIIRRALAEQQGTQPIVDLDSLLGGSPEDEPLDNFLAALSD
jgi:hypothetical protein